VMGGPLTAAAFDDTQAPPLGFLTDGAASGAFMPISRNR